MPKIARELSPLAVRRLAARPGYHAVGGVTGLYLYVKDTGASSWVLRKMVGDERRHFGCGGFPTVDLAGARSEARRLVLQLRQGIDPVADRKAADDALRASQATKKTFGECAHLCHAAKSAEFKNAKHRAQWINTLTTYAFPTLERMPVELVDSPHVLDVLTPIWQTKTETATRVRQRIEAVLAYAVAIKARPEGMNPAAWSGRLQHALPKARKLKKRQSHPAMAWRDVGSLMPRLMASEALSARAIVFAILTAARSQEVRKATWAQIDLTARTWTVPAALMKAGKPHVVPLSDAAVALLKAQPRLEGCALVFPSVKGKEQSDSTLSKLIKEWQVPSTTPGEFATVHGFRSSFKDWAREAPGIGARYSDEVSELALAHVDSDETRAAYARGGLLDLRRKLMSEWAKHCTAPALPATVTPIRKRA